MANILKRENKFKKTQVIFAKRNEQNIFAPPKQERLVLETKWSVRLGVRTLGFHLSNRGSIPLRTTKNPISDSEIGFFLFEFHIQ